MGISNLLMVNTKLSKLVSNRALTVIEHLYSIQIRISSIIREDIYFIMITRRNDANTFLRRGRVKVNYVVRRATEIIP